jgi:tRNA (adenine22-N1)-methyltransferase
VIKIDQRLKAIADLVDKTSSCVADIGTDHAYLPIYLIQSGRADYVYATDIGEGPLFNAQSDIDCYGLKNKIETRLGSGLKPIIGEKDIDTVIIAGMGGKLMSEIMKDSDQLSADIEYIFAPHASEMNLRIWLADHQFLITKEQIIEDQNRIYELITAHHVDQPVKYEKADLLMGPFLRKEKKQIFLRKWQGELAKRKAIQKNRKKANKAVFSADLEQEIKLIEENL